MPHVYAYLNAYLHSFKCIYFNSISNRNCSKNFSNS